MMEMANVKQAVGQYMDSTPPAKLFRQGVYWGVVVLASVILGSTIYHLQAIPSALEVRIHQVLHKRPWVRQLVVVDGRDVFLRGEAEPDSELETEIRLIEQLPGVNRVTNMVQDIPRPAAHLKLVRSDAQIELTGQLSGEVLEAVVAAVETRFPHDRLLDLIQIDDRLGRPMWVHGFEQSLQHLTPLGSFELDGWRDKLVLNGLASDQAQVRQIGYSIPASLIHGISLDNRLRPAVAPGLSQLTLVSDWSGTSLSGRVANRKILQQLEQAAIESFGEQSIAIDLVVDQTVAVIRQLDQLNQLMPALALVHDLRLESSGKGYILWGRVDDAFQLGQLLQIVNQLQLTNLVSSEIFISGSGEPASLSVFSDQQRATMTGTLPTIKSRQVLIDQLKSAYGIETIRDLISIEPNIEFSDWIDKWPVLLTILPNGVAGVTINDKFVMVTGTVKSETDWRIIDLDLTRLFPHRQRLNWIKNLN